LAWLRLLSPALRRLRVGKKAGPTDITVLLTRRRERDDANDRIVYSGYDIHWPDGRPVSIGLERFCQQGTRLLLGRARNVQQALIRVTLYPISGLDAEFTRPGQGIRCKRFYSLLEKNEIRFHFFTGTPTEVVFHRHDDDPEVLRWLHAERVRQGHPFWFDLASEILSQDSSLRANAQLADCV
jgi:hypothetical protein